MRPWGHAGHQRRRAYEYWACRFFFTASFECVLASKQGLDYDDHLTLDDDTGIVGCGCGCCCHWNRKASQVNAVGLSTSALALEGRVGKKGLHVAGAEVALQLREPSG